MSDELLQEGVPEGHKAVSAECANADCPGTVMFLGLRMMVKPLGTHSLSGNQMKASAKEVPVLVCRECGAETLGRIDEDGKAVFDRPKDFTTHKAILRLLAAQQVLLESWGEYGNSSEARNRVWRDLHDRADDVREALGLDRLT